MMISPGSRSGSSNSIKSSTGRPAFTINITLRGFFKLATSSCKEKAPIIFLPFARPSTKFVTFSTVRLKTATVKPLLSMFMTRFSPITAKPMRPRSAFAIIFSSSFMITGGKFRPSFKQIQIPITTLLS